jgi:hypothetical protein
MSTPWVLTQHQPKGQAIDHVEMATAKTNVPLFRLVHQVLVLTFYFASIQINISLSCETRISRGTHWQTNAFLTPPPYDIEKCATV